MVNNLTAIHSKPTFVFKFTNNMNTDNEPQEIEQHENSPEKEKPDFETPALVTWMKEQYRKFQELTAKDVSDNVWLIGLKFLFKGIMVLILIIMSPFILFMIIFSLMIAG